MKYIEMKNVTKTIKTHKVLDNITLSLEKNQIYGFRGGNGSGKTMLLRAMLGLIRLNKGEIIIAGKVLKADQKYPVNAGILLEKPAIIQDFSAIKNLELITALKEQNVSKENIKALLQQVGLDPEDKRRAKSFSLGMKQKLGLAQALISEPELLILDEPSNGLDEESVQNLMQQLLTLKQSQNVTIILTSHDRNFLQMTCDQIFEVQLGRLV
ncbi:ABC transporter ATP-binding protein [Listeria sp. PSOL-1]|uniref:ABC transporter ATP-binding protein n=1 Tax=Listeria sp. PSOL-1 TaxID=1844999 RepID=UPI0013D77A77|nr:ABC transporter ATP-binding protein [Listeria sp. PSOL-1]